jgi:phosphohistidine phosphatase SixA
MRHGIAEDTPPLVFYKGVQRQGGDFDRRLTEEGVNKAKLVVNALTKVCDPKPLVIASPLVRAQQTASLFSECFAEVTWAPEVLDSLQPDAYPVETISDLNRIISTNSSKTVVVVGHQPHISALCSLLVTSEASSTVVQFGRATAALLETTSGLRAGAFQVRYVLRPKVLS